VIASIILGLILGVVLNRLIERQLRESDAPVEPMRAMQFVPIIGSVVSRAWLRLAVELLTLAMTIVLWRHYGWTLQFWLLLAASLVLIDTAAIDWKVKLIDTLIMVAATIVAIAVSPLIIGSWILSFLGMFASAFVFLLFFIIARMLYPSQAAPFGLGDVYLGMFIGALLGLGYVGPALMYGMLMAGAASLGLILVLGYKRARYIPISYGTFLCLGVLLYLSLWPL
jgi:leader peptidase (prepilin peptidase) / N-methyltransferase